MARILLADDDGAARDAVHRALLADGHQVTVAHDGQEALALAEQGGEFDILVTDVQMPGLDGISLASQLRARRPALKVLLMSGYPEQLARGRSLVAGPIGTLTKPCNLDDLRSALRGLTG